MRSTKRPKRSAAPKKAGGGALEGQTLVQVMGWPTRSRKKLAKQWKACGATVLDTAEWKEEPEQATACVFFDAIDATDDATSKFIDEWAIKAGPECEFLSADEIEVRSSSSPSPSSARAMRLPSLFSAEALKKATVVVKETTNDDADSGDKASLRSVVDSAPMVVKNGNVHHAELIGVSIDRNVYLQRHMSALRSTFRLFDCDSSGVLSHEQATRLLHAFGRSPEDSERIIAEIDADNDDRIDFEEFLTLMSMRVRGSDSHMTWEEIDAAVHTNTAHITPAEVELVMNLISREQRTLGPNLTDYDVHALVEPCGSVESCGPASGVGCVVM